MVLMVHLGTSERWCNEPDGMIFRYRSQNVQLRQTAGHSSHTGRKQYAGSLWAGDRQPMLLRLCRTPGLLAGVALGLVSQSVAVRPAPARVGPEVGGGDAQGGADRVEGAAGKTMQQDLAVFALMNRERGAAVVVCRAQSDILITRLLNAV